MLRLLLGLPIALAACLKDETISGYAGGHVPFVLVEISSQPVGYLADIYFPEEGTVAGRGPCNSFTARQLVPYPWFQLSDIAVTRRACPELDRETEFFTALQSMTLVEVSGDVLILSNDDGGHMVFQRPEN